MGKLIPLVLAVVGLGGGVGAGLALRPVPDPVPPGEVAEMPPCGDPASKDGDKEKDASDTAHDYVKLNNQFVVPVVNDGRVGSLVVVSISLEVEVGQTEAIYQREPKLRDALLRVMFDHANAGGFDGDFTNTVVMAGFRRALREVAQKTLGKTVTDVLIIDIIRQDA